MKKVKIGAGFTGMGQVRKMHAEDAGCAEFR